MTEGLPQHVNMYKVLVTFNQTTLSSSNVKYSAVPSATYYKGSGQQAEIMDK